MWLECAACAGNWRTDGEDAAAAAVASCGRKIAWAIVRRGEMECFNALMRRDEGSGERRELRWVGGLGFMSWMRQRIAGRAHTHRQKKTQFLSQSRGEANPAQGFATRRTKIVFQGFSSNRRASAWGNQSGVVADSSDCEWRVRFCLVVTWRDESRLWSRARSVMEVLLAFWTWRFRKKKAPAIALTSTRRIRSQREPTEG